MNRINVSNKHDIKINPRRFFVRNNSIKNKRRSLIEMSDATEVPLALSKGLVVLETRKINMVLTKAIINVNGLALTVSTALLLSNFINMTLNMACYSMYFLI